MSKAEREIVLIILTCRPYMIHVGTAYVFTHLHNGNRQDTVLGCFELFTFSQGSHSLLRNCV